MQKLSREELAEIARVTTHKAHDLHEWATSCIPRYGDKNQALKDAERLFAISSKLTRSLEDGDDRIEIEG